MSFDRFRVQQECERLSGCINLLDWPNHRTTFEALDLTSYQASALSAYLIEDGSDLYYKGLLSLCEAIHSMNRHLFSWATVKAYYSLFYFLRSSLAVKGYAIVRNGCLYLLPMQKGGRPIKKSSKRYSNDHLFVISIYRDMFAASDILQSNNIDGSNPYEWMMDRRNQVNYRQRQFHDPIPPEFLSLIAEKIDSNHFESLITSYVDDTSYLYCFQPEHACLALPISRLLLTRSEYDNAGFGLNMALNRISIITNLLTINNSPIKRLQSFVLPVAKIT